MTRIKKLKFEDWTGIIFWLAAAGMLLLSVRLCFHDGIWYDELYTMGLTERSFPELTGFTARDVHPPFYYYYVKLVQELCLMAVPGADVIVLSKICSVIPLLGLAAYAMTKVRKHFGLTCAGIFIFCVTAMPSLPQYTVEVRMYTLSMFLVTAAFLHAYEIVAEYMVDKRLLPHKNWIFLVIYGILAAYTHYFAAVAAAMIYLYLLSALLIEKGRKKSDGERKALLRWTLCIVLSVLAYIPWMSAAAAQISQVKESYWILPLTWRTFGSCIKFLMKPQFGSNTFQVAAAVLLFVIYVCLLIYTSVKRWGQGKERQDTLFAAAGTGILAGVVLFGFAASFLIRPVFIVRYMVPAAGCFWLAFALFVSRTLHKRYIFLPVICVVLLLGIGNFRWFRNDETWRRLRMEEAEEALEQIEPEALVITIFNHVQGVTGYYLDHNIRLWNAQPEELICSIIEDKYDTITSPEEIIKHLRDGKQVWFIGSRQADVLAEWEKAGIYAEEKQEVMLEVYWITFYRLFLKN